MPLLASSLSFTRYRVVDPVPDQTLREATSRLRKNGFRDIDATTDERSYGFVAIEDFLDSDFISGPPEKAHFLVFSLRLDTRRISPAVFKKHLKIALNQEKNAIKEAGKGFLSKDRKKELADQVKLKLMARALPIPAVFDVFWNLKTHVVSLATTNTKVRELFEDAFTLTFDLHLTPLTPTYLAEYLAPEALKKALDDLEPSPFAAARP